MADRRRDKTAQIPPATIAELLESRKKLARRQDTLDLGVSPPDERPNADVDEPYSLHAAPRGPIPRDELEAMLGPHLEPFAPGKRLSFLQAFEVRAYARGCGVLEEDAKRQPKNLSMAREARALRQFAMARLENELGGLHVSPRVAKPLSTVAAPDDLESMLRAIDGQTPIERILRNAKIDRLRGIDFLAGLARSGHIELPIASVPPPEEPSLTLASSRSQTRPKVTSSAPPPPLDLELVQQPATAREPAFEPAPVPTLAPVREEPSPPSFASERPPPTARSVARRVAPPSDGPRPAVLIALGAAAMIAVIVGVVAIRGSSSSARPATTTPATGVANQPLPPAPTPTLEAATTTQPSAAKPQPTVLETVQLKIRVDPPYARVTVDGVLLTGSPIEVQLPKDPKEHELRVESTGFKTHTTKFTAEENASFVIALQRLPPKH